MKNVAFKYWLTALLACLISMATAHVSAAQSFINTTPGNINNNTLCPGATGSGTTANLTRTFNVSGLGTVTDLNVGFIATHTWRGDIRMTLTAPSGTGVGPIEILFPDTSGAGNDDDYNIEIDDEADVEANNGIHDVANDTTDPPYQFWVTSNRNTSPDTVLSVFDGINPNGTWTMRICDDYQGENGQFLRGELLFQSPTVADLSLTMTTPDTLPDVGVTIPLTIQVTNAGLQNANVTVQVNLPGDMTYDSHSGPGSYNSASGLWTLPVNLANGATQTLILNVIPNSAVGYTPSAEIASSNRPDPDSTPNNNSTTEDDDASVTIFAQPPATPPDLNCPIPDRYAHIWSAPAGTNGWPAGLLTRSYSGTIPLSFTVTDPSGSLEATGGANTPVSQNTYTGGTASEYSIAIAADFGSPTESITLQMDLGTPGEGVEGVQFRVFDVDIGGFIDRLILTGSMNGTPAPAPILTSSGNNFIAGNQAIGINGNAGATASSGNVTVTFLSPVDEITMVYDNDPLVGSNPAFQLISLHTITMCPRRLADITAEKLVETYDPGATGNVYMTPGSEILYKIRITNSAAAEASADDIDITDTLPPNLEFIEATTTGFIGGSFGSPALPTLNQDCGDTACVIRFTGGSVPIDTVAEVIVRAVIK